MNIVFFNHFHNGDVFHAKEFVRDVAFQLNQEVIFAHRCDPIITGDLFVHNKVLYTNELPPYGIQMSYDGQTILINTHVGKWFGLGLDHTDECTLRFNMSLWEVIYQNIGSIVQKPLVLNGIRHYIPKIDFNMFKNDNLFAFIITEKRRKILICNGPVQSNQCLYNADMSEMVTKWAQMFPQYVFILTHMTPLRMENVCYTSEILKVGSCDLNEIAYLANWCDLIIGRNSGPYCFSVNDYTVWDPKRKFIAFGERETDCFLHGVEVPAKFKFIPYTNANSNLLFDLLTPEIETL